MRVYLISKQMNNDILTQNALHRCFTTIHYGTSMNNDSITRYQTMHQLSFDNLTGIPFN